MITGKDFYHILSAVVPLYVAMFLAYASVKWWKLFSRDQCAGINKFVALFSVPLLSFEFISKIEIYKMNMRFIIADSIQKVFVLIVLFIWAKFSKKGSLEWSVTLFSTTTMPNTLVLGIPLCQAMYGDFSSSLMIQVVFLQVIIWNNFLLIMYEFRATRILINEQFPENVVSIEVASDVYSIDGREEIETEAEMGEDGRIHIKLRKSASCNNGVSNSRVSRIVHASRNDVHLVERSLSTSALPDFRVGSYPKTAAVVPYSGLDLHPLEEHPKGYGDQLGSESRPDEESGSRESPMELKVRSRSGLGLQFKPISEEEPKPTSKPPAKVMFKLIFIMVWRKLMWNPNTYASVLGLIWALLSKRLNLELPEIVAGSIAILSKTGLGMAMFSLGLFMALQPKLIACGNKVATLTLAARLILGPLIMVVTSLVVGLKGAIFKVAIVQAALPQAITPFVFAKEYNVHAQILSTGVIFGLLISLPFAIVYYILLELIK